MWNYFCAFDIQLSWKNKILSEIPSNELNQFTTPFSAYDTHKNMYRRYTWVWGLQREKMPCAKFTALNLIDDGIESLRIRDLLMPKRGLIQTFDKRSQGNRSWWCLGSLSDWQTVSPFKRRLLRDCIYIYLLTHLLCTKLGHFYTYSVCCVLFPRGGTKFLHFVICKLYLVIK